MAAPSTMKALSALRHQRCMGRDLGGVVLLDGSVGSVEINNSGSISHVVDITVWVLMIWWLITAVRLVVVISLF